MSEEDGLDDWAAAMAEQADDEEKTEGESGDNFGMDAEVAELEEFDEDREITPIEKRKLDRVAGEPLDVLVNGTLIAHGEVVVVNDKFGIRLTDVISQLERIKKLR
jgi:flagellar motor switch protein FliN/FliY